MKRFILTRRARRFVMLGVGGAALAVVLAACTTSLTGGGWLWGYSSGKANVGFNLTCDENGYLVGTWTYHDKGSGIDIAGTMTEADSAEPDCLSGAPTGVGESRDWEWPALPFTMQHCKGSCTGTADVYVYDSDVGGNMKGDYFSIVLSGSYDDGYGNAGTMQGGNLVVAA
jgi:hypothetical protein